MTREERLIFVSDWHGLKTTREIADECGVSQRTIERDIQALSLAGKDHANEAIAEKIKKDALREEKKKGRGLVDRVVRLEKELEAVAALNVNKGYYKIPQPSRSAETHAVAVALASDWHVEETVKPWTVNDLNEFNEEVCHDRVRRYFQHILKLVQLSQQATNVETLIIALLGDLISGQIHDELMEGNRLRPVEAAIEVQKHFAGGIRFLLDNSDLNLVIPCHSGNHGRITRRVHWATEAGNSLEKFIYTSLAREFAGEERVKFIISDGMLSYVKVWNSDHPFTIRFCHGHQIRYYGGVGGLTIPVNKAIAQWDKARPANLTCLGHFHQLFDGGNFIVNGSLIGFNAFALSIKASPEPPQQAFFLIDSRVGKTLTAPIILTEDR